MVRASLGSHCARLTWHRDESFNSITGLNGSGKSNILDSICFVLGITNMTTVRAQNLQVWLNRRCACDCIVTMEHRTSFISAVKPVLRRLASRSYSITETRKSRLLRSRNMQPSVSPGRSCWEARRNTSSTATERSNRPSRTSFSLCS